jgi:hypothetical protein
MYFDVNRQYAIHIATNKVEFDRELLGKKPNPSDPDFAEKLIQRRRALMELMEESQQVKLDSPYAGKSYYLDTAEEAVRLLLDVRASGLHVPVYVIDMLEDEIKEEM